ncbi:MAG: dihydrolipoyllysine-residue acetyltransferase [Deltaproteobacteria bacterium]|nr:MAG: dihydrolipoyllysine-residue acetyltransferase [Deltaproteobacteria bacterium]
MSTVEIKVPDIGDFKDVPIIEVFVKPGDAVKAEDPLIALESDKATMDVPSPSAGTVKDLKVKVGDRVSQGKVILVLDAAGDAKAAPSGGNGQSAASAQSAAPAAKPPAAEARGGERAQAPASAPARAPAPAPAPEEKRPPPEDRPRETQPASKTDAAAQPAAQPIETEAFKKAHASPSVRKFARELGVDLSVVKGSGPKERILQEDVQGFVKQALSTGTPAAPATGGGLNLLPWPRVDFAKFGQVETKPLSRIKKIAGANLARNWVMIPHVTQFDEADITDLEALRVQLNKENEKAGIKVTLLAFLIKACVAALKKYPEFNASLEGDNLVLKKYFHIGFAADTPNGLVVPVIRDADRKGVLEIAQETASLAGKAREGKLSPADMQGGSMSISSLGGIGGTAFTPIINAPEVAILGVSKSLQKPVWDGKQFAPRLVVPLSLSYDHRVIDGAAAARFTAFLTTLLADMRRAML